MAIGASAPRAAGASHDLMQQWEGALGRARVAVAEAEVAVDDADEVELGEMVPLRHQLGADDDVDLAGLDLGQFLAQALDRRDEIAREHQDAALWKQRRDFLLEPLDARPAGDERLGRLAFWARGRRRRLEPALMTHEAPFEAMLDQPAVPGGTMQPEPAGAAQGQRRVAAGIEEQQRLLAACDRVADRLHEPG